MTNLELIKSNVTSLAVDEAVEAAGSEEIYIESIEIFFSSIDKKTADLETFAANKDYVNFKVAVHALKSSARIVGDMKLSEDARLLEMAALDNDGGTIDARLPKLLADYRAYKEKLYDYIIIESVIAEDRVKKTKEEVLDKVNELKTALDDFDIDLSEDILKELGGFEVDADYDRLLEGLSEKIQDIEYSEAINLIDAWL